MTDECEEISKMAMNVDDENQPPQLKDEEIHLITKSVSSGTSSNEQQNKLPENQPLQLNDQEIPPIGKSGDKATSSNNQKKRKTPFDSLKDSLSANEKVDGKRQRKPRSIDD